MKTKLNLTKLVTISLLLAGILNIQVSVAETTNDPIAEGFVKLKELFSSLQTTDSNSSLQANNNYDSPAHRAFNQSPIESTTTPIRNKNNLSGNYKTLSDGNKKIANALFNAQPKSTNSTTQANVFSTQTNSWSLDEIASANAELNSWGRVFNLMKQENLIKESNLGQVIRNHSDIIKTENKNKSEPNPGNNKKEAIVITNAKGDYLVINRTNSLGPDNL